MQKPKPSIRISTGFLCICFLLSGFTIVLTPVFFIISVCLFIIYKMQIKQDSISNDDLRMINGKLKQKDEEISKKDREIQYRDDELKRKEGIIIKNRNQIKTLQNDISSYKSKNTELEQLNKKALSLLSKKEDIIKKLNKQKHSTNNFFQESKPTIPKDSKDTFVLCAGRYEGGKDIPIGKYNLYVTYGSGSLFINTPKNEYLNLSAIKEEIEDGSIQEYRNLLISDESVLEIDDSIKILFSFQEEYTYSKEISKYELKYKDLKNKIEIQNNEIKQQNNEIEDLLKTKQQIMDSIKNDTGNELLSNGVYKIGEDIDAGKYDLTALSGSGYITLSRGDICFEMNDQEQNYYRNLNLIKGSKLEIDGNLKISLSLPTKIQASESIGQSDIITQGTYKIGTDIAEGSYILEPINSWGSIYIDKKTDLYFDSKDKDEARKHRVFLKNGSTLEVEEDLKLKIYKSNMITGSTMEETENHILYPGFYEIGVDIPFGYYNLSATYGAGRLSLKTSDKNRSNFYKDFSFDDDDEDYTKKYRNILFGVGDTITIDGSLEIRLEFSRPYTSNYSSNIISDFNDLNKELSTLNNTIIEKYYSFSNYDGITSQDCQNKLILLKQQEKEMRTQNKDIKTFDSFEKETKREKLIRQALRCFNAECDNIIMNVELKNIDSMRNKVQKSFDTINQLYFSNGLALSYDFLQLKLEQVTLIYTQMLKAIQEREIQQEIKEQMKAEAKAEREIEEQKRKVEKDLKQHLSQVNRLMKFMQKTQLDAERQLYIDQIKELEEKIKILEADKEKITEREANAKAGFVYIISNIGSFGEDIYKIGMTRRLEPMDRIKELSSASVPFEFDVHAMIFSSDAPELENMLHKHFSEYAVNKVNPRKEFFKISLDNIEKFVKENFDNTVQFTKIPLATEYRQSLEIS